jgi:GPH family glycoside/pentoside/hexuronide:cation symporter
VAFYLIWSPDPSLSPNALFMQLLVWYLALYTFWTVFNIPYVSLGMELTPVYHERTRLFAGRQIFYVAGTTVGMLAPALFATAAGDRLTGYTRMGAIFGGLSAVLIFIAFLRLREQPELAQRGSFPFFQGLRVTFRNRAFVVLLFVYLVSVVGGSFIAPLTLYMAKYVIKAEWVVKYVMLAYMAGSLFSIPLWLHLSRRMGKNRAWTVGLVVATIGYALSYTYTEGTWIRWIVLAVVVGSSTGCTMTLGPAIAADVIDSDELETGKRREGAFMGVWSFVDKAAIGLAVFVGLQGLEAIGYVPNVDQTPTVIAGMKFLYCLLPAVCHLAAVLIFQRFPMTPEVHAQIRAELDSRASAHVEVVNDPSLAEAAPGTRNGWLHVRVGPRRTSRIRRDGRFLLQVETVELVTRPRLRSPEPVPGWCWPAVTPPRGKGPPGRSVHMRTPRSTRFLSTLRAWPWCAIAQRRS